MPPSAELAPAATIVLTSGRDLEDLGPRRGPRTPARRGALDGGVRQEQDRLGGSELLDDRTAEDGTFVIRSTSEARDATPKVMFTRNSRYDAWSSFGEYAWGENNLQLVSRRTRLSRFPSSTKAARP